MMAEYLVTLDFWWGSGQFGSNLCTTEQFTVSKKSEIPGEVRRCALIFSRRYSFDCGRLGNPLHPRIGNVKFCKIEETHYLNKDRFNLDQFMALEEEQTRKLIEDDKQFVNGQYNYEPHPRHKRTMKWKAK
jgi:hypothetical protein